MTSSRTANPYPSIPFPAGALLVDGWIDTDTPTPFWFFEGSRRIVERHLGPALLAAQSRAAILCLATSLAQSRLPPRSVDGFLADLLSGFGHLAGVDRDCLPSGALFKRLTCREFERSGVGVEIRGTFVAIAVVHGVVHGPKPSDPARHPSEGRRVFRA
jgi:hypothetical protein